MLNGKNLDLAIVERGDLSLLNEWVNDPSFMGEYEPILQETNMSLEKQYDRLDEGQWFFVQKKDGTRIGYIVHYFSGSNGHRVTEIGYALQPSERGRGYGSEAVKMMVDYLFLSKNIVRIQAMIRPSNAASRRILEKAGFSEEGILRKSFFCKGAWRDTAVLSILREEWKEPKILTITR